MMPGRRWQPEASMVSAACGITSSSPIATMIPSRTARLAATMLSGDTIRPLRMTRSTCLAMVDVPSSHRPAAIDREVLAGDVARALAGEEPDRVGDVLVGADPAQRILLLPIAPHVGRGSAGALRALGADALEARPVDHAGRDRVDVDVVLADLERDALGQTAQAPFRRAIGGAQRLAPPAERAPHIHDLAHAPAHHPRPRVADGQKPAARGDVNESR